MAVHAASLLLLPLLAQVPGEDDPVALYGERWTPEARVYQLAGPSVVSIDVYGSVKRQGRGGQQRIPIGQGSGVVIHPSGLVITNAHVAAPEEPYIDPASIRCLVTFDQEFGGGPFETQLLNLDREWDLALLRIEAEGPFRATPLGSSDDLIKGERVIAIGTPFGNTHSITSGILSGVHREIAVGTSFGPGQRRFSGLLQTDAAINQGNSGGPLLNVYGELIGINNATLQQADGIGFAIPADRVREILDDRLLETDYNSRFWAGMKVGEHADGGLVVTSLHPRGPASQAGVRVNDRILGLDGEPVGSRADYAAKLLGQDSGDEIELRVQSPRERERRVRLQLMRAELRDTYGLLGFEAARSYLRVRRSVFDYERMPVLRVVRVFPGTGAEDLGLEPGDLVIAVRIQDRRRQDGWVPVGSLPQLASLVRGPTFELEEDNFWILRGEESYKGRLVFDDPEVRPRP